MRHKRSVSHFGRRPGAHKSLLRGLVDSLVEHERIRTTLPKAKELRRHVEKAVTKGKGATVHTRRILASSYPNSNTVKKICDDLSVRFKDRPGGYTRIIKAGKRPGDNAAMALIEFVDYKLPAEGDEKKPTLGAKDMIKRAAKYKRRKRKLQNEDRRQSQLRAR